MLKLTGNPVRAIGRFYERWAGRKVRLDECKSLILPALGPPPAGWQAHYLTEPGSMSGISERDDETQEQLGWPLGAVFVHKHSARGTPDTILWFSQQGLRRRAVRGTHRAQEVEHAFCWLAAEVMRRLLLP